MNPTNEHGGLIGAREIHSSDLEPGFEVSWAGEDPFGQRYCFGSEDGRLMFLDPKTLERSGPFVVAPSREAVNGVALTRSSIVVSTREDVVCVRLIDGVEHVATLPQGAHGVCVSSQGEFYAPVGQQGLLKLVPRSETLSVSILSPDDPGMEVYFYRIACLSSPARKEVLACALRRGGFAVLPLGEFDPRTPPKMMRTATDIIDVCSLGMMAHPLAAVGLGINSCLHLFRDPFAEGKVKTIRFPEIQERAYRVLCAEGHVFLLTNRRLCALVDLATAFLEGTTRDELPANVHSIETEAVDISLTTNRTLLVTKPDRVIEIAIDALLDRQGERSSSSHSVSSRLLENKESWSDSPSLSFSSTDQSFEVSWSDPSSSMGVLQSAPTSP